MIEDEKYDTLLGMNTSKDSLGMKSLSGERIYRRLGKERTKRIKDILNKTSKHSISKKSLRLPIKDKRKYS